jgi:DNA-binding NtrC family response regulator
VGGVKEFPTDFRLVSATNRPLRELVEKETFRGDLFYRINAVVIELPPLRDRPADIPLLVDVFLKGFGPAESESWAVAPDAMALMESYSWPGNVRELRNVIERAALLAQGRTIRGADLGTSLSRGGVAVGAESTEIGLPTLELANLERIAIEHALDRTGWHQGQAAEILGVSARTLHRKIKGFGLKRPAGP